MSKEYRNETPQIQGYKIKFSMYKGTGHSQKKKKLFLSAPTEITEVELKYTKNKMWKI
jgi:hypothetical protein